MHLPSWLLSAELQQNLSNNLIRFFSDPKTSYLKTCQSLLVVEKYSLINIALFKKILGIFILNIFGQSKLIGLDIVALLQKGSDDTENVVVTILIKKKNDVGT